MSILSELVAEMRTLLVIQGVDVKNVTRPGEPIREGDKMSFDVWLVNSSEAVVYTVKSWTVDKGSATDFATKTGPDRFVLAPGAWKKILENHVARVVADPAAAGEDPIARVTVHADAKLSAASVTVSKTLGTTILPG
ncbi:MAG: hypothetical protein L6Q84_02425 [Polyangiaceae bacterium]|nr:hypothetical protein [Polyangiaceae bacterium]